MSVCTGRDFLERVCIGKNSQFVRYGYREELHLPVSSGRRYSPCFIDERVKLREAEELS